MRKLITILLSMLMILTLTACGAEDKNSAATESNKQAESDKKIVVAYFSCTGTTKTLAENAAEVLNADLYEIKPKVAYSAEDLNWEDETTRATVEQRDEKSRPELAETNADFSQYKTIVLAFPIWWGVAPRIIDTFVENYDLSDKVIVPICTSGGSDIGTSAEYLKQIAKGSPSWRDGKCFMKNGTKDSLKEYFNGLGL